MCSLRRLLTLVTFGCLFATAATAQVATADIVGRITDNSGAVLPGVTVNVVNTATRAARTAITGDTGDFVVNLLPIGTYTVSIELQGFQPQTTQVTVASGDRARVDAKLQLGTVSEQIQVTAEAQLVQTDTSTVSSIMNEKAVQDLPVNGRNFIRLVQMVPGATEGGVNALSSGNRPDDRRQTSAVSINGAGDNQNNQMIDGMDNNERAIGTIGVKPSMDAIAEIKVQTNLYSAETGRTGGGVINILTKSGSNDFHGSGFEFMRNDRFDARNFFATTKPLLRQHQFGGSLGGPIVRDRTFFFADYEGFRQRQGQTNLLTVPTVKMRSGDFSELSAAIYDPLTNARVQFPGNVIPGNRLDPIATRYMALYPLPTSAGQANNYASTTIRTQNSSTADFRVDHRFDDKNSIFGRYSINDLTTVTPGGCPTTADGIQPGCLTGTNAGFPGPNTTTATAFQANWVRIFTPTLISEFKAGYVRTDIESLPANYGMNLSQKFGLPNVNIDQIASGLALMNVAGYTVLGDTQNIPLINKNFTRQVGGSLTMTRGGHNLKMGASVVLRRFSVQQSGSPNGIFAFDATMTRSATGTGGNALASFLLGYPTTVQRQHSPFDPRYHTNEPAAYVQDDWRANSWLTVNLGLRYDVFTPFTEEHNQLSNLDLATSTVLIAGQNGVSRTAGVKTDYSDIGPRVGFAATLPGAWVLRGGYGISYFPGNIASFAYMKNAPFVTSYGPVTSDGSILGGIPNLFLAQGLPLPVAPATGARDLTGTFRAVALDFKSTRVQQFNVIGEKEIAGNVVGVGYIGSRGDRVALNPNVDLAPPGPAAVQPRRVYSGTLPNLNTINVFQSIYETSYDAMQLAFQRRYRGGLSLNTHYTLAHATSTALSTWDVNLIERSDAAQDARHHWVLSANYDLPWGKSLKGIAGGVLAGWQINAIANWQSGIPFGVTNNTARMNTGGTDRPDMVANPELPKDQRTLAHWFNTDAFVAQALYTPGSAPPIVLHGPPQRRLDLSLFKDVTLRNPWKLQLRAEIYNVTNTPSFQNPSGALGSAAFGSISSTGNAPPRQMQFAAKLLF